MPKIHKIVLTGGPCAGKSSAKEYLRREFSNYHVLFCPESATTLLSSGFTRDLLKSEFQPCISQTQVAMEEIFLRFAACSDRDVLLIFDRGIPDGHAYLTDEEFNTLLARIHLNEPEIYDRYDAVFHLVTAADGAEEYYNLQNTSRDETPEQARALDRREWEVYAPHPHHFRIENTGDFDSKMQTLCDTLRTFLSQP